MTLIAAVRCRDGMIFGSDSRETRGGKDRRVARTTQKLFIPRVGLLLAWAGAQDVAQGFVLRLARARGLSPANDRLEVKARLHEIVADLRADSSVGERSDYVELLVAWWSRAEGKPVALHIFPGGAGEWVSTWAFGGAKLGVENASFAIGVQRYVDLTTLALEQAEMVVLKVLRDTIATTVDGIGGPVQMATVRRSGAQLMEQADVLALHDAVDLWESQCAELLGNTALRSARVKPDRGVRPPR